MMERDGQGVLHVGALSGGGDSTCMALLLSEREPRPYAWVCTPTGDELPEMFEHWRALGDLLGSRLIPVMAGAGLISAIRAEGLIPNFQRRWCTRKLKIEPFVRWLRAQLADGPVVAYVGLRADEPFRLGGSYGAVDGIELRYPLREWGMDEAAVDGLLEQRNIRIPERTDCARCYHQQIGEWWRLWHGHRALFEEAAELELELGYTFRTPAFEKDGSPRWREKGGLRYLASSHDSWPARLADMALLFELGFVPTLGRDPRARDLFRSGPCAVCVK